MRSKLLRIVLWLIAAEAIFLTVGFVLSKKLTKGDELSDEFQVAAICGGKKFVSHAGNLTSASAIAAMGGIALDLRDAVLDPAGADLTIEATMGGIEVVVPDGWAVDLEHEGPGGFELQVAPPDDLPDDAPRLHVHAVTRLGGGVVKAQSA